MSQDLNSDNSPSGPLKILIAGAGIAGLTTALALRQEGHLVTVFERSSSAREAGAALHLAPNCNGLLRRLGIYAEKDGANVCQAMVQYGSDDRFHFEGDMTGHGMWEYEYLLAHRVHLHETLKLAATGIAGAGTPAILKTNSRVVDVDPGAATLTLEDGQKFHGDLIVGADGVGSATRKFVRGGSEAKPFDSGKSAYRFLISRKALLDDPQTASAVQRDGVITMWVGSDRRLVMYPCAHNTLMNFVAIHPSGISNVGKQDWDEQGSKDNLLQVYKEFGPRVQAILGHADRESLKVWTLLDMEKLPTWIEGKLALIGDAAHPFLPHQGQGGGAAIEDAISLAVVLPRGTKSNEVPERLELFEKIRYDRAHRVQHYTRLAGKDISESTGERLDIVEYRDYNLGHDEWHNSRYALKQFLFSKKPTIRRQPLGFSPMISPRQLYPGSKIPATESRFKRRTIRFKTSRTYLETLFPSSSFSFTSPASVAEATFRVESLNNLGWLGGGGYHMFGLFIHGVQYTKKDGSKVHGTYLPVLFENLADPIITGREELGFPKVFCDIEIYDRANSTHVACSWRGAKFANLEWQGLAESTANINGHPPESAENKASTPTMPEEQGVFVYRCIPAVGTKGEVDAEYPVLVGQKGSVPSMITRTDVAETAKANIDARDWEALPTLHHIAEALSEICVIDVIEAKVVEGSGVDDLSHAQRLE